MNDHIHNDIIKNNITNKEQDTHILNNIKKKIEKRPNDQHVNNINRNNTDDNYPDIIKKVEQNIGVSKNKNKNKNKQVICKNVIKKENDDHVDVNNDTVADKNITIEKK